MQTLTYSGDLLRMQDHNHFLLTLLAPKECRRALWAFLALNSELEKIRHIVNEPAMGHIRLQWWADVIKNELPSINNDTKKSHPILNDLHDGSHASCVETNALNALVSAYQSDFDFSHPQTIDDLTTHLKKMASPIAQGIISLIDPKIPDEDAIMIITNDLLIGRVCAVAKNPKTAFSTLPQDLINKHGFSLQKLYDFNEKKGLSKVVEELVESLNLFQDAKTRFFKGQQAITIRQQKSLENVSYDIFAPTLQRPAPFHAFYIWWASR